MPTIFGIQFGNDSDEKTAAPVTADQKIQADEVAQLAAEKQYEIDYKVAERRAEKAGITDRAQIEAYAYAVAESNERTTAYNNQVKVAKADVQQKVKAEMHKEGKSKLLDSKEISEEHRMEYLDRWQKDPEYVDAVKQSTPYGRSVIGIFNEAMKKEQKASGKTSAAVVMDALCQENIFDKIAEAEAKTTGKLLKDVVVVEPMTKRGCEDPRPKSFEDVRGLTFAEEVEMASKLGASYRSINPDRKLTPYDKGVLKQKGIALDLVPVSDEYKEAIAQMSKR